MLMGKSIKGFPRKKEEVMEVNEAIEYLNEIMEEQFDEFGYHEIATEGVRDLLKTLVAENKAYKGMWNDLYEVASKFNFFPMMEMDKIENKYLGGLK